MSEDNKNFLTRRNQETILRGDQLKLIEKMADNFGRKKLDFERFKMGAGIGFGYMLTLPSLEITMKEINNRQIEEAEEPDSVFRFEDVIPKSWQREDPNLRRKTQQFTQLLSEALDVCKANLGNNK